MLNRYDRIIFTLIALALAALAVNPWIAPGKSQAQSGLVRVDIVGIGGKEVTASPFSTSAVLPVEIKETSKDILK